jgi:hypothetical protein
MENGGAVYHCGFASGYLMRRDSVVKSDAHNHPKII